MLEQNIELNDQFEKIQVSRPQLMESHEKTITYTVFIFFFIFEVVLRLFLLFVQRLLCHPQKVSQNLDHVHISYKHKPHQHAHTHHNISCQSILLHIYLLGLYLELLKPLLIQSSPMRSIQFDHFVYDIHF